MPVYEIHQNSMLVWDFNTVKVLPSSGKTQEQLFPTLSTIWISIIAVPSDLSFCHTSIVIIFPFFFIFPSFFCR